MDKNIGGVSWTLLELKYHETPMLLIFLDYSSTITKNQLKRPAKLTGLSLINSTLTVH